MEDKPIINSSKILWIIAVALAIPALWINLGMMPYTSDEPTRAIVTLEMIWSGQYITPTFTGEYYYNKPPMFNWWLIPFLAPNGGTSELWLRIPAILALLGFLVTIYHYTRKWFGNLTGILAALMFLTCGRILFWDSMLGLIDILYSWVTFTTFMVTIDLLLERKFLKLFLLTYLLTSIGFMLKGMPSLVFQALTLLTATIAMKEFRRLFSWQHVAGVGLFLLLAGSYLWAYSIENSPEQYLAVLWDQSSQRTAVRKGWFDSIQHLVMFHPEMIYHFFPWSAAVLLLLNRNIRKKFLRVFVAPQQENTSDTAGLTQQNALRLMLWIFAANIMVYWLSPATIPRYVLMLAPLTFIPLTVLVTNIKLKMRLFPALIITLLLLRIAFNLFWLPEKSKQVAEARQKVDALRMATLVGDAPLRIAGKSWIDHSTLIYLMSERQQPIHREHQAFIPGIFYLADEKRFAALQTLENTAVMVIDSTFIRHQHETAYLIKLEPIHFTP